MTFPEFILLPLPWRTSFLFISIVPRGLHTPWNILTRFITCTWMVGWAVCCCNGN